METYKVKALYCPGTQNKIYKAGDLVPGHKLKDADDLVKRGFVELVPDTDSATLANTAQPELTEEEKANLAQYLNSTEPEPDNGNGGDGANNAAAAANNEPATKPLAEYTAAELKQLLTEKGVKFNKNANRADLLALAQANQ